MALDNLQTLSTRVARVHGGHDPRLLDVEQVFTRLRQDLDAPHPPVREVMAALQRLRDLTAGFEPPAWACTSYRSLLAGFRELEEDLLGPAKNRV